MKKFLLLAWAIFLLGAVLRLYRLPTIPAGLNLDEVAMGYNAYSLLKTGHDEYGAVLPIYFRSHDDYKPPFIIYTQVPSVAIFGLNALAVRLPSALMGILGIVLTYHLVTELFPKRKKTALLASFLFAISPWALQFNRTAYEVGMQPTLTTGALYFFLSGLRLKSWLRMILAGVFFGLGPHLYTASRVFVPTLLVASSLLYRKELWGNRKLAIAFATALLIFLLPAFYLLTTPAGQVRFKGTSILQDYGPHAQNLAWQTADWLRRDRIGAMLFHSEKIEFYPQILSGYFAHLRLDYLFLGNSHSSTNYVPNAGLIYAWELPFIVAGFFFLFKQKNKRIALLLTAWIILAPLPASVTSGIPSSIRTTIFLPAWQIISAFGILTLYARLITVRKTVKLIVLGGFCGVATYALGYYLHMYYIHAPIARGKFWYSSYPAVVTVTQSLASQYQKVIVSNRLDQPQSFFLFYTHYDPKTYFEKDGGTVSGSFSEDRNHFGNFEFKPIHYSEMSKDTDYLYVGVADDFPKSAPLIQKFLNPDGSDGVYIVGNKKN